MNIFENGLSYEVKYHKSHFRTHFILTFVYTKITDIKHYWEFLIYKLMF